MDKAVEMKPGRELDALVAEKVMGWSRKTITVAKQYHGQNEWDPPQTVSWGSDAIVQGNKVYTFDRDDQPTNAEEMPKYSTDIAAAWEVAEKLHKDSWRLELVTSELLGPDMGGASARFACKAAVRGHVTEHADTAPHAICLAALKAVGHIDK
jgi:hypothetical protein